MDRRDDKSRFTMWISYSTDETNIAIESVSYKFNSHYMIAWLIKTNCE